MEREVVIYADKYESELKMSLTVPGAEGISPDITLGEYANWWLERRKDELSASHYVNCQTAIKGDRLYERRRRQEILRIYDTKRRR